MHQNLFDQNIHIHTRAEKLRFMCRLKLHLHCFQHWPLALFITDCDVYVHMDTNPRIQFIPLYRVY